MRISRFLFGPALVSLAAAAALPAQVMGSISGVPMPPNGPAQANRSPYTLTRTMTTVQTLADGTTITRTSTTKTARDSQGRTYHETHQIGPGDQTTDWVNAGFTDPVARTFVNWNSRSKIATVMHMPDPQTNRPETQPRVALPDNLPATPPAVRPRPQITREELGLRTIAGIEAKGVRTTQIIPAGEQGNDRPITIVMENWMSAEYGVQLLSIRDDPRTGKMTDEVTDFQSGEPDPALFQIPEGYTVREQTPAQPN